MNKLHNFLKGIWYSLIGHPYIAGHYFLLAGLKYNNTNRKLKIKSEVKTWQ